MAHIRIRKATLRDLPTLVAHRRRMWEDIDQGRGRYTKKMLDDADPVYARWAKARLRSGRLVAWIAENDKEAVGSGCVWLQEVQPRPTYPDGVQPYLLSMWTDPAHRGRGVASKIVGAAIRWVDEHRYPRFSLHASRFGRRLYKRLGFERTWEMWLVPVVSRSHARAAARSKKRGARPR